MVVVAGSTVVLVEVAMEVVTTPVEVVDAEGAHATSRTATERKCPTFTKRRLPVEGR